MPPEVKTTSDGRQPMAPAMVSRDSSTTRRASRPEVCSDDALPVRPSCSVIASIAAGRIGVVAAWSRYRRTRQVYVRNREGYARSPRAAAVGVPARYRSEAEDLVG